MKEFIDINIDVNNKSYLVKAYRKIDEKDGEIFVILANELRDIFTTICDDSAGTIFIETEPVDTTINHCVAKCRITANGISRNWVYGESVYKLLASDAEKNNPFSCAVSRAEANAIQKFLGLQSRAYRENGTPILFNSKDQEFPFEDDAVSADGNNTQSDENSLNDRLAQMGEQTITVPINGKSVEMKLKDLKANQIDYIINIDLSKAKPSQISNMTPIINLVREFKELTLKCQKGGD